jgi:hypothetical protein
MDARKPYAPPAIVAEDVLEQTSLACNATQPFRGFTSSSCFGGQQQLPVFAPGLPCQASAAKGGAFTGNSCRFTVGVNNVVVLS